MSRDPHSDLSSVADTLLEGVRRAHRQVTRNPRRAIESAVSQLLGNVFHTPRTQAASSEREFRIDELAREVQMTTRNVRAYQERGLLPPPRRSGRVALFNETHVARLKLIGSMLERGYAMAHIQEMLTAWEEGRGIGDVLGLEDALVNPRAGDRPETTTVAKARELAGGKAELDLLVSAGLVSVDGTKAVLLRPGLLKNFEEVRRYGLAMEELVALHQVLTPGIEEIARTLVAAGAARVAQDWKPGDAPSSEDMSELIEMLVRFRTLAISSVMATLEGAIENDIRERLTDLLVDMSDSGRLEAQAGG